MSLKGQEADTLFPYPNIPDNLTRLDDRSNYLVSHFWERCNLKTAFYSKEKFRKAFSDYIEIIPYAHRDTVKMSVDNLIEEVKKDPKNLLTLGKIAQDVLYGDSAQIWSDELYLSFAQAVANSRKISKEERARFQFHAKVLSHSQEGMTVFPLETIYSNGSKGNLHDVSAPYIIVFINETDCDECMMTRVRLAADIKTNELINSGKLEIISLSPCDADEEWLSAVSSYPQTWKVMASPETDSYFDMRMTPSLYLLDQDHKILAKNFDINALITIMSRL